MRKAEINIEELINAYNEIGNFHKLGEMFHTSHIRIKKLLLENNIELKSDSNGRIERLIHEIIEDYNTDVTLTLPTLSKKYNIPLIKLRKAFKDNGVIISQWRNHTKKETSSNNTTKKTVNKKITSNEYIKKVKEIHSNKYDYSLTEYTKAHNKIKIICPKHGIFEQKAYSHLQGTGCPKCGGSKKLTLEDFINRANEKHLHKYDFSKVIFKNVNDKMIIICPQHGEFKQRVYSHLQGHGCPLCKSTLAYSKSTFISKAKELHNSFYEYKNFNYDGNKIKGMISCPIHGDFFKTFKKNNIHYDKIIDNCIHINNYKIYYHQLKPNKRNDLNNISNINQKENYKTIHIFEDEYYEKGDIIFKKLKHILKCNTEKFPKIMGRKCKVREINKIESGDFLNKNHIQGFVAASIYLGAFYEDKLVAVMSFLEEDKNMWNLNRFATDINYICQGIGGKLFQYFLKNYKYQEIKSFADRRWTTNENDNLYIKLGFKKDKILFPDYRYIDENNKIRYHKFAFRKQALLKKYPDKGLNNQMTELQMTQILGFSRIYDCGLIKYIFKKNDSHQY